MLKSERERARTRFGRILLETGDYRAAAEQAGVSLRTGRRWRAELRASGELHTPVPTPAASFPAEAASALCGRSTELQSLAGSFSDSRLVLVHGATGVGKTRLATEFAHTATSRGELVAAHVCRLSDAHRADDVLRAMAQVLGVRLVVGDLAMGIELVGREIAARGRSLWLLDGWDQSLASATTILRSWLGRAPHALFLVTSSSAFELPRLEASSLALDPLAVPTSPGLPWSETRSLPGVRLLLERLGLCDVEVVPSPTEQRAIAEIAALLGGAPLAIEIACAGARSWELTGLFARLSAHPALCGTNPAADAPPRARVEGVVDWAIASITPAARAALACASVFAGDFTRADAARLIENARVAPKNDVAALLAELRERTLLRAQPAQDASERLYLPPVIRRRAQADLSDADERRRALACHADLLLAAEGGGRERSSLDAEDLLAVHARELALPAPAAANAQRALRAAMELAELPGPGLPSYQKLALLDAGIEAAAACELHGADEARAHAIRARARFELGDVDSALAEMENAVELAAIADARATEARTFAALATAELLEMRLDTASEHLERAISTSRAAGDRFAQARAAYASGIEQTTRGRLGDARRSFEEALVLQRMTGDREGAAQSLTELAGLCHLPPYHDLARGYYAAARALYSELGDRLREAYAVGNLALVEHTAGRLRAADDCYRIAIELGERTVESELGAILAGQQGAVAHERGQNVRARACYQRAIEISDQLGETRYRAIFTAALGALDAAEGRLDSADALVGQASELSSLLDDLATDAVIWLYAGHLDLARAREAATAGDAEANEALLLQARTRLESATAEASESEEVRIAERMLRGALGEQAAPHPVATVRDAMPGEVGATLFMDTRGRAFRAPGGSRVDLSRRKAIRRVLLRLLLEHDESPGRTLAPEALVEAGWPDRTARRVSGSTRADAAISALRDLGLGGVLARNAEGWQIERGVAVRVVAELD